MKNFKKAIGFIMLMFLVLSAIPSVSYAAGEQYTENLIPTMTSNTSPSGIASCSSKDDNNDAYRAFDKKNGVYWKPLLKYGWVAYEFPTPQIISKYVITSNEQEIYWPKNWSFEAWDEQSKSWIRLDSEDNGHSAIQVRTFQNTKAYKLYKLYIGTTVSGTVSPIIYELEMMSLVVPISVPANLTASPGNTKVDLSWNAVDGATGYNIKRSATSGGPYTTVSSVTGSAITFTDTGLTNGTTYYYVVSAVNASGESANSNEASATPIAPANVLKLVLEVKEHKQLSMADDLGKNTDMTWTSSDTAIATVDENGLVKALKPGDTVITCTSKDGDYTETIKVLVVDLNLQLAVDLLVGETCRLTVDDAANTENVTWTSYNPAIATVTNKGKVTAISEGLTYITATDGEGKEIGRIYIRVRQ